MPPRHRPKSPLSALLRSSVAGGGLARLPFSAGGLAGAGEALPSATSQAPGPPAVALGNERFAEHREAAGADRRADAGDGRGGRHRIDGNRRRGKAPAHADELGDLRNLDGQALANPRPDREVERLVAEIERSAHRGIDLLRLHRDRAVDPRHAARERQTDDGAAQLRGGIDRAKRIDRLGETIERHGGIDLGVDERGRADHRPRAAVDPAHPLVRGVAAHRHVDGQAGLSASHLAGDAGGGEQRGEIELAALDAQGDLRSASAPRIDGQRSRHRPAIGRRPAARARRACRRARRTGRGPARACGRRRA